MINIHEELPDRTRRVVVVPDPLIVLGDERPKFKVVYNLHLRSLLATAAPPCVQCSKCRILPVSVYVVWQATNPVGGATSTAGSRLDPGMNTDLP